MDTIVRVQVAEGERVIDMQDDLISRQDAIEALCKSCCGAFFAKAIQGCCDDVKTLQSLPSAQPKKGEWIDTGSGQECSVCREVQYGYDNYRNFCPNCGADMRKEVKE